MIMDVLQDYKTNALSFMCLDFFFLPPSRAQNNVWLMLLLWITAALQRCSVSMTWRVNLLTLKHPAGFLLTFPPSATPTTHVQWRFQLNDRINAPKLGHIPAANATALWPRYRRHIYSDCVKQSWVSAAAALAGCGFYWSVKASYIQGLAWSVC